MPVGSETQAGSAPSQPAPPKKETASAPTRPVATQPHKQSPPPAHEPAPQPPPSTQTAPVPGIPQGNGGDHDIDNNGGPSDGDGQI